MAGKIEQGDLNDTINQDILNSGGNPYKPLTGTSMSLDPLNYQNVIRNPSGSEKEYSITLGPGDPRSGNTSSSQSGRVGDYVFTQSGVVPAKNSITDWKIRYDTSIGKTERQGLSFSDWMSALSNGIGAYLGAPTDTSSVTSTLGTAVTSQAVKSMPGIREAWAFGSFLNKLNEAQERHNEDWEKTLITYSSGVSFVDDGKGGRKAVFNYDNIANAGNAAMASGVADARDTSKTGAELTADNKLKITASDTFLHSAAYQEMIDNIHDKLKTLTAEEANTVVSDETGATLLESINKYVKDTEASYYYTAQSIALLKEAAPTASDEALAKGSYTMLSGWMKDSDLKDISIFVYDEQNNGKEVNAKEYYDTVKAMSKVQRNNLMTSLGDRVNDADISDDEKAVLQAQANALYALSSNSTEYKGMFQKGMWDAIADTGGLVTGIRLGDFFGVEELDTFTNDDIFSGLLQFGSSVGGMLTMSKIVNGLEGYMRKGTTAVGKAIGDNKVGKALQNIDGFAPQDVGQSLPEAFSSGMRGVGQWAAKTATQVGYQLAADATFDAAKAVAYAATGNDYDFLKELQTDFLLDTVMTYGPAAYRDAMAGDNGEKLELRPVMDENGHYVMDNNGVREMEVVRLTAEDLAKERAQKILDFTGSKAVQKVQEMFFDGNAAMSRLALQVMAKTGDNFLFRKMLRMASGIRTLTRFAENDFRRTYSNDLKELGKVIKEVFPKVKDMSQADIDYINAAGEKARFTQKANGDVEAIKKINAKYDPAIKAVSAERAAELDRLRAAMAKTASNMVEYYKSKGVWDKETADRIAVYEGYYPIWTKNKTLRGGDIKQTRAESKKIFNPNELIDLKDLDNPLVSLAGEISNMARNVAINERALAIREAASVAGVDLHIIEDDGGALREVKNLRELNAKFEKRYQSLKTAVYNKYPDQVKWQSINDKIVVKSGSFAKHDELVKLQGENKELQNRLRREQRALKKAGNPKEAKELADKVFETKTELAANRQAQALAIDQIQEEAIKTMKAAKKKSLSTMEIDIDKYVANKLTKDLKAALKKNNTQGAIQAALNKAVKYANPWVDPALILQSRAEAAAEGFRRRVAKDMAFKKSTNPRTADQINRAADAVTDNIVSKVLGKNGHRVTVIGEEGQPSRSYVTGEKGSEISYKLGGKSYTMKITGTGSDMLVEELKRAEATLPKDAKGIIKRRLGNAANKVAQAKRYLTTASDPTRMLPNLLRDWTRGIVTTGGLILLSPGDLREQTINSGKLDGEAIKRMDEGWRQVADNMQGSTFTKSLETPKKNRPKSLSSALNAPDGDGFVVYSFGRTLAETTKEAWSEGGTVGEKFSVLQDTSETYTRMRAMTNAYYNEVGKQISKGASMERAIERGMEAAYFYGVEATQNFGRRGTLIETFAKQVPYLTQKFSTLESFKYAWIDDPIAVSNSLKTTVTAYASAIAILLSNEESRKRYYMLSEYDRANNILISLDNETIVTIPLDDTIAAFLTPYRRAIETLNGVDPEAFYLWGVDFLEALSPLDLSGFSEGDKLNVVRGLERLGSELIPTWAQPIIESWTERDLYYGSDISMNEQEVGEYYGIYNPTPGQMTTKSKDSKILAEVANLIGMPQWQLQNYLSEYGSNVSQYILSQLDKLAGATQEQQGGKEFMDAIFKPFTGNDSDSVSAAFTSGISELQKEKVKVQNEIKTINTQLKDATPSEKASLMEKRQKVINDYGTKVSDFISGYLQAYEITGGLTSTQANRIWYLYVLYDDNGNSEMTSNMDAVGENYYYSKAKTLENKRATELAAMSGASQYINPTIKNPVDNYYDTYGEQFFRDSVYGSKMGYVSELYKILEKNQGKTSTGDSFYDLREKAYDARSKAYAAGDYDSADAIAYSFDKEVVLAVLNYIQGTGKSIEDVVDNTQVLDYLSDWIMVPSSYQTTKKGKYVSSLRAGAQKEKAFKKPYTKYLFGLEEN